MSFLVQDTDIYLYEQLNLCHKNKSSVYAQIQGKNIVTALTSEPLPKYLNNPNCTLFQTTSFQKIIIFRYYTAYFYKNLPAIASIHLNLETLSLKIQLKLLNHQQKYIGIVMNEKKKIFFKFLSKQFIKRQFNIKVGTVRGEITIYSPYFYLSHELVKQKWGKAVQKQLRIIKNSLKSNFQLLDSIFQISQEKGFQKKISSNNRADFDNFIKNYHYQKIMNLELCFASENKVKEQDLNNRLKQQKQSINKIKNNLIPIQSEIHPLFIYTYSLLDEFQRSQLFDYGLKIAECQRNNIKQKIQLPSIPKEKCTEQNFYVLNYVITNDRCSLSKCRRINKGGFTQIFLTQLIYWYIGSYIMGSASQMRTITSRPPLKKYVIVKHQNKELLKIGQRSRVDHQKYILNQIKNGLSIFLCKYYIADKNSQLKEDLLSDYIDYPNLSDYYKRYCYTMSLHTKIYFSILIAQSLRYLQQYKIVHLDLKPSNIMTTKRLSIKIIDFGQSYHPDLAKHVPGFSMPYSAPQNYGRENGFTFKNDVFSLGVMMFELFYGKKPFFFYSQQLQSKVYNTGNFYDYLFFCPQQSRLAGQTLVLPLIQAIISKCLSANHQNRPELEWIVFILRQCLDYIY